MKFSDGFWGRKVWACASLLLPALASAAVTLDRDGAKAGAGQVHVLQDSSGIGLVLSGDFAGATAVGAQTGGTLKLTGGSGLRLTTVLKSVEERDTDGNGRLDEVKLKYEGPVSNATAKSVFTVGGSAPSAIKSVSSDGKTVTLSVDLDGTDRKTLRYTAASGVFTDGRGLPVLHWPGSGRNASLCGVLSLDHTCFAEVEKDLAKPVVIIADPATGDVVSGTFGLGYSLSEPVKSGASAPVTITRVRGVADGGSPHITNLGSSIGKGSQTILLNGTTLNLVEGTGYRIAIDAQDNADVGDPYTAANTGQDFITNVIFGNSASAGYLYVDANAASGGNGSLASPYKTITAALSAASGGGNILVLAGLYQSESFPLKVPSNVELRGVGADLVAIRSNSGCSVLLDRVQNVEVVGFRIQTGGSGADYLDDSSICVSGAKEVSIHNNVLIGSKTGLRTDESAPLIQYNTITENLKNGAGLRYPVSSARLDASVIDNIIANNDGTCVYLEIPPSAAQRAGSIVHGNVLFPAGCGSDSAQSSLAGVNTFSDPQLDDNLIAQGAGTTKGWNNGNQGTIIDVEPTPPPTPTVSALNSAGFVIGILVALIVAALVLRKRPPGPPSGK